MAPMVRQEWDVNRGFSQKKKKKKLKILPLNFLIFLVLAPKLVFFNLTPQILNPSSAPGRGEGIAIDLNFLGLHAYSWYHKLYSNV
jgi:hypothetical protein